MYMRNNDRPNIDSWAIPQLIYLRSELKPLIVTNCVLFLRYEENQLFASPLLGLGAFWESRRKRIELILFLSVCDRKKEFMFNGGRNSWNSFAEYLIRDCIFRVTFEKELLKAFAILNGEVTVLLLSDMEEGEKCDTVLSEIKFFIPFQVFFKLFRLSLKNKKVYFFSVILI